jgi:peptide/nickel transport system substrate-binding protein
VSPAPIAATRGPRANQINATPYANVPDGGNMRWPIDSFPANFNIYEVDGNEFGVSQLVTSTLPLFWMYKADGTPFLNKDVVDSASSTTTTPISTSSRSASGSATTTGGTCPATASSSLPWS